MTDAEVDALIKAPIGYRFKSQGSEFLVVGPVPEVDKIIVRLIDGKTIAHASEFYTGKPNQEERERVESHDDVW